MNNKWRHAKYGRIHKLAAQIGLLKTSDDTLYRETLLAVTGKDSCKKMTSGQLAEAEAYFIRQTNGKQQKAFQPAERMMRDENKGAMLRNIERMLTKKDRSWAYAHAIAKKRFGCDRVEFCTPAQVHKLMVMLKIDENRGGAV